MSVFQHFRILPVLRKVTDPLDVKESNWKQIRLKKGAWEAARVGSTVIFNVDCDDASSSLTKRAHRSRGLARLAH